MTFIVEVTTGQLSLAYETATAEDAVAKAAELMKRGKLQVMIIAPDGREYLPSEFDDLVGRERDPDPA